MTDPTPQQLLSDAAANDSYTFLFCRRDEDNRWRRDAKFIELGIVDPQVATDEFWSTRDPEHVLLSCCLHGTVATVDAPTFADEPDINDSDAALLLDEYDDRDAQRLHYTVFAVCDSDGNGYRRFSRQVDAVDPLHAELLARDQAPVGEFLVAGVVELWVPVVDLPDYDVYATPDGKPHPPGLSA